MVHHSASTRGGSAMRQRLASTLAVLCVAAGCTGPPVAKLPDAVVGVAYEAEVPARAGGGGAVAVVAGELPEGMTLDGSARVVRGAPTRAGDYTFTIAGTKGADRRLHRQRLTLHVAGPPS